MTDDKIDEQEEEIVIDEVNDGAEVDGVADELKTEQEPDESEVIITIDDEEIKQPEEHASAPEWVRELRKSHRETVKENRELKARLNQQAETKPALGNKPALADFDYDTEKYEASLAEWFEAKRASDAAAAEMKAKEDAETEAWQSRLNDYSTKKKSLKVADYDSAESAVLETLSQTQQAVIIQVAKDPALIIYALGNAKEKLKEISSITNPANFAYEVGQLEKGMRVKSRTAPPPEQRVAPGTGAPSGAIDSTLERLRAKAAATGDYSEVTKYKRQKRKAAT